MNRRTTGQRLGIMEEERQTHTNNGGNKKKGGQEMEVRVTKPGAKVHQC